MWRCAASSSVVLEVVDFAGSAAGSGGAGEVDEGEALVLRHCGEAKVLGAEEEQRVEQHYGGVGAQLLALPQVGLQYAGGDGATLGVKKEAEQRQWSVLGVLENRGQKNKVQNSLTTLFINVHLRLRSIFKAV